MAAIERSTPGTVVDLDPASVYEIGAHIEVPEGVTIDGRGATIRLTPSTAGDAAAFDRMLVLRGDDVTVRNVRFVAAATSEHDMAANVVLVGARGKVEGCTFASVSRYAVMVVGDDATVTENHITGSGVLYGWDGSQRARVVGNSVIDAPANGLTGTAHGTGAGHTVTGNRVVNAGRMGIEDDCTGTSITGNRVTGSGSIGISAVGDEATVHDNSVSDAAEYGIETAAEGTSVAGNRVTYTDPQWAGAGIAVNGHTPGGPTGATIHGNTVHNAHLGIHLVGALPVVTVAANVVSDATQRAISLEPLSADAIACHANSIRFDQPATSPHGFRDGIVVGGCRAVTVTGNAITYTAGSAGPAQDFAIRPTADTSVVTGNVIDGGGRTDAKAPRVSPNGETPTGVQFASNALVGGATSDLR